MFFIRKFMLLFFSVLLNAAINDMKTKLDLVVLCQREEI